VVAGDEKAAVARLEAGERRHMARQLGHAAVDQVAGDGHQVGRHPVDAVDDGLQVRPLDGRSDVDVADLGDGEALQGGRQPGDGHLDRDGAGRAAGVGQAPEREQQAEQGNGRRRAPMQAFGGQARRPERAGGPPQQQARVAHQRQHRQRREQPHGQQAEPGQLVRAGAAGMPASDQAQRGAYRTGHQQQGEHGGCPRSGQRRHDAQAHIGMEEGGKQKQGHAHR